MTKDGLVSQNRSIFAVLSSKHTHGSSLVSKSVSHRSAHLACNHMCGAANCNCSLGGRGAAGAASLATGWGATGTCGAAG